MAVRRRSYSAKEREQAVRMVADGSRPAAVARELGIGAGNIRRRAKEANGRAWAEQVARHYPHTRSSSWTPCR